MTPRNFCAYRFKAFPAQYQGGVFESHLSISGSAGHKVQGFGRVYHQRAQLLS